MPTAAPETHDALDTAIGLRETRREDESSPRASRLPGG
jgi:hypothetical protein